MSAPFFHRGCHAEASKLLAELRASYQGIADQQVREWGDRETVGSLEPAHRAVEAAIRNLERIKDAAQAAMAKLAEQRLLKAQAYRQLKLDHGILRDARTPNILTTILIAQGAMLVEGTATAALMVADGKMDIPAAAAYGASVTVLNFATGMFAGYFTARYLNYRADSPTPGPRDHRTRWIARAGFAALVTMLATFNFGAARVRATGSHSGIFDFQTASFFATFDDYYAWAVLGLGVLGGMLGIYKGYSGISDPIPGFTEARREAEDAILEAAPKTADQYLNAAETTYQPVSEYVEDAIDALKKGEERQATALADLNGAILAHDHKVDSAVEEYLHLWEQDCVSQVYVTQKRQPFRQPDTAAFEKLRYPPIAAAEGGKGSASGAEAAELMQRLDAAYDLTCAAIEEAHAAFLVDATSLYPDDNPGE